MFMYFDIHNKQIIIKGGEIKMARKFSPGTGPKPSKEDPTRAKKNRKEKKPNKGKSLFSFGRKKQISNSRKNLKEVEEYDDTVGFEEDIYDEREGIGEEFSGDDMNLDLGDFIDEEEEGSPHISYEKAANIYGKKSMEQTVFMYSNNEYFPVIQKHYNSEFRDIRTIGTSALNQMSSIFSERAISKYIMLFVLEHNEVSYIKEFINSLGLDQIQPNVLNILIVIDSSISVESLLTTEHQRKFIKVRSINMSKTPLTKTILNKLMSVVVQDQPAYVVPEKDLIEPKKVNPYSVTKDISRLNSNDLSALKDTVKEIKKVSYGSDLRRELVRNIVGEGDINSLLNKVEDVPHLKIIKAVEDEVEEQLELIRHNPRMKDQVEEMISRKLLLSTMRTAEMEVMISDIIDSAVTRMESVDKSLRDYNRNAVMELKEIGGHDDLLKKREEIKTDISDRFGTYKALIQMISNSANIQAQAYINARNEIGNLLSNNRMNVSEDIMTVTTNQLQIMDSRKDSYLSQVKVSHDKMIEALDVTNKLLESYKILVSLDDVIINSLLEENEILRQMQPVRVNVESTFKSNGINLISLPGSGMLTIFNTFLTDMDLIVYHGSRNIPSEIPGIGIYNIKEFLSTGWERPVEPHMINLSYERSVTNPMEFITESEFDLNSNSVVERLISKLDYVSSSYANIYVIFEPSEEEVENIENSLIFNRMIGHLKNLVVWTPMDSASAAMTSMVLDNIHRDMNSVRVFLNKVKKDYQKDLEEFKSVVNRPITTLIIPYISNIENHIESEKEQIIKALKNIKNRMR